MNPWIDRHVRGSCVAGVIVVVVALAALPVSAQDYEGQTQIRELSPLSFGQIAAPKSGVTLFKLHWQHDRVTTRGVGDGIHLGGATPGRYRIQGQPYQTITVTAQMLDFSARGVVLEKLHLQGTDNTYSTALDGQGVFIGRLGGIVAVRPGADSGNHHANILITVDYE